MFAEQAVGAEKTVSIVVPMRNEKRFIGQCLMSLIEQDFRQEELEILVVDGMSSDGSREIVDELSIKHSAIRMIDNPGLTAPSALNIGIPQARGRIIIRVDAHTTVARTFVSKSMYFLDKTGADCVGGRVEAAGEGFWGKAISFALSCPFGVGGSRFRCSEREEYVDTVAFGAYRREIFEKIGLFDERLVRNQDIEFNARLRKSGGKIFFTPEIRSYYHGPTGLGELAKQAFRNGFWNIETMRIASGSLSLRHFVPLLFVLSLVIGAALALIGAAGKVFLAAIIVSYLGLSLIFAVRIAAENGFKNLPAMPLVFMVLHISYGVGSLWGIVKSILKRD